ncbi:hypothetical protein MH117_17245 [Paenibacillus sp. ACRRX]|uniref:hypothetical protein n=1 Tax=Paenibacillus sp. ACRRX TaxID=2918206 RepID=UPI001EF64436|nr:hypothetical protein [Paenibacillus sp. ACRRX]MCG7409165.1 hypothetical protein [Paenibacillus sp. ACRRX]
MAKLELVVADQDKQYLEMLSHYIHTSEFAGRFVIRTFSNEGTLKQFTSTMQGSVIFLINPGAIEMTSLDLSSGHLLLHLTETNVLLEDQVTSVPVFYKYQPLNQLLSKVFEAYVDNNGRYAAEQSASTTTSVIAVYSAIGNSGKTVTAVNLAAGLASQAHSVFYLNLELLNSSEAYMQTMDNQNFSQLLYFMNTDHQKFAARFETLKASESNLGFDYFNSHRHIREIEELSAEGATLLVETIANLGLYEFIVVDLDTGTDARTVELLRRCDTVLWLLLDDLSCLTKTRIMLQQHAVVSQLMDKSRFLLNKHLGSDMNADLLQSYPSLFRLPYVPQWKAVTDGEQLLSSKPFNDQIAQLARSFGAQGASI